MKVSKTKNISYETMSVDVMSFMYSTCTYSLISRIYVYSKNVYYSHCWSDLQYFMNIKCLHGPMDKSNKDLLLSLLCTEKKPN